MKWLRYVGLPFVIVCLSWTIAFADGDGAARNFNFQKAYFYNFYSVCTVASGRTWFVGSHGMICRFDPGPRSFVVQDSGTLGNLYSVSFVDDENGWIVGQDGLILHTGDGGRTWKSQESHTGEHLFGVTFHDLSRGWIIGAFGTLLGTEDGGKTWSRIGRKVDRIYNDMCFVDGRNGWVVGEFGGIVHTADGGKTWEEQKSPLGEKTLFGVYFEDTENGWITGMDGSLLKTVDGGAHWQVVASPVKETLLSIQVSGHQGWAVGLKGILAVYDGSTWTDATVRIPTRAWLKKCLFPDPLHGWIVGSVGTILRSDNGGKTWYPAADMRAGK